MFLTLASAILSAGPSADLPRVLVYTVSAGYEHEVVRRAAPEDLSLVERALQEIAASSGRFEAVVSRDAANFEPETLAKFRAVFFYTTGELPLSDAQRSALLTYVASGGGFAGAHSATDTFYADPRYGDLIGAYFDGHPWHENVRVAVLDRTHLATSHLGDSFEIVDEIYQFREPYDRSKLNVLLRLDPEANDLAKPGVKRSDRDFALAWTKDHAKGRVFYTALGHRPEVWADPRFRLHLEGGLRWAMRDEPIAPRDVERAQHRAFALSNRGDPARGFEVFRRDSGPMCARCHAANGYGGTVGPDISDVGIRLTKEALVESILEPSRTIDPLYRATTLELSDGRVVFGHIVAESADVVEIADTNGKLERIPTRDVVARRASDVSVMPEGLAGVLTKVEFADLVAWLGTLRSPASR